MGILGQQKKRKQSQVIPGPQVEAARGGISGPGFGFGDASAFVMASAIRAGEKQMTIYKAGAALVFGLSLCVAQAPDNSKMNERDKKMDAPTAVTQSNSKADLKMTRLIRHDLMESTTLSTYAKNVKVITQGGRVTLRGPVRSQEEKTAIEVIAKKHAGETMVDNQLEIAPSSR